MNDLNKFAGEHWAIEPHKLKGILSSLPKFMEQHAHQNDFEIEFSWGGTPQPRVELHGSVAVIPVYGPLAQNISPLLKYFGFVDYLDVARALRKAAGEADTVVLDFDSPGGTVTGAYELQQLIKRLGQKGLVITSFTNSMRASGAELISTSCSIVTATPSAIVGSIGTMMSFDDLSVMFADMGISVELFASGPYKGMGTPGTSLSGEQEFWIQSNVERLADEFKSLVQVYRDVDEQYMQGQTFRGSEAESIHLIDYLADSREAFIASLQSTSVD